MKNKPQVAGFIYYYIENVNSLVARVGYFPASDQALADDLAAWKAAVGK